MISWSVMHSVQMRGVVCYIQRQYTNNITQLAAVAPADNPSGPRLIVICESIKCIADRIKSGTAMASAPMLKYSWMSFMGELYAVVVVGAMGLVGYGGLS